MIRAALVLAAGLAVPAAAQDRPWDCADFDTLPQQGINYCLGQDWQAQDARLNAAYQQALQDLNDADRETLRDAQRAWIAFRDAACDVEAGMMRGGSGEAMLLYGCMARLTERRAEDLETLAMR